MTERDYRRHGFAIALLWAVLVLALHPAWAGTWIADPASGCKLWNPNPTPGETASWKGACKDGFAEGKGVLTWFRNAAPYEHDDGEWRAGRQMGNGSQTWPGGSYRGELFDGLPQGRGVLISGGARYEGAFIGGKPNGKGTLTDASGSFDGQWRDGCFDDGKRRASFGGSSCR